MSLPSSWEERLKHRLADLIRMGNQLVPKWAARGSGLLVGGHLDEGRYYEWRLSSLSLLERVVGSESRQFMTFITKTPERLAPLDVSIGSSLAVGMAILRSVHDDMDSGVLGSMAELVRTEVFSDFLAVAAHLSELGYKDPAVSLTGAVLENGLRSMARQAGLPVDGHDDLSSLDQKLFHAKTYGRVGKKQVQYWIGLRNAADHGQFAEYTVEQAGEMVRGVRSFLTKFLGPAKPGATGEDD